MPSDWWSAVPGRRPRASAAMQRMLPGCFGRRCVHFGVSSDLKSSMTMGGHAAIGSGGDGLFCYGMGRIMCSITMRVQATESPVSVSVSPACIPAGNAPAATLGIVILVATGRMGDVTGPELRVRRRAKPAVATATPALAAAIGGLLLGSALSIGCSGAPADETRVASPAIGNVRLTGSGACARCTGSAATVRTNGAGCCCAAVVTGVAFAMAGVCMG
jgi:hypothetical protein